MPTYQYKCPKCGQEYEKLQNINDNARAKCPRCGTRGERVLSGGAGLIFKGSGFYLTDYGRSGQTRDRSEKSAGGGGEKTDKAAPETTTPKPAEKAAEKPKSKPKAKGDS